MIAEYSSNSRTKEHCVGLTTATRWLCVCLVVHLYRVHTLSMLYMLLPTTNYLHYHLCMPNIRSVCNYDSTLLLAVQRDTAYRHNIAYNKHA